MAHDNQGRKRRLTPAQRARLAERLKGRRAGVDPAPDPIPDGPLPLTPLQRQLWAFARVHPEHPAYHMHSAVRMSGALDAQRLRDSVERVVARHAALRTVFVTRERRVVQEVHADPRFEFTTRNCDPGSAISQATDAARRPFDLLNGPLLRLHVLSESPDEHLVLLVAHHIIADEWSLELIWKEIRASYHGEQEPAAAPMQFPEYVSARQAREEEGTQDDLRYWVEQLEGVQPLDLPTDRPRTTPPNYRGAFLRERMGDDLARRLRELSAAEGTTPFVVLLALYGVLLNRLTGSTGICVGVPSANRTDGRSVSAVGLFIDSLPLRCETSPDADLRELIAAMRRRVLDGVQHPGVEQSRLADALGLGHDPGRPPLFQTMFVNESDPLGRMEWEGLSLEPVELDGGTSKFDFTLFVNTESGRPTVALEFDRDLFEESTARRVLAAYLALLRQAIADPSAPARRWALVEPSERERLMDGVGAGPERSVEPIDVVRRIVDCAAATPNRDAVVCGERSLTYGELMARSGSLASRLVAAGVRPGDAVGLYLDPSVDMVVGVVGVLRAGAAYVPLDPSYPRQRLRHSVDDLAQPGRGPAIVVTGRDGDAAHLLGSDVRTVPIAGEAVGEAVPDPESSDPDALAYVIYTSGSSGRPKGVGVTRANLAASTAARIQTYGPAPRFLLLSSFAFDSSVAGLFGALATGGTLVITEAGERNDPAAIARRIAAESVTHTLMLPSLWQFVLRAHAAGELKSLRVAIVAGEECTADQVRTHFDAAPQVALYNEYGPTEATVWATVHRCEPADIARPRGIPIGRPIPGATVHVLDPAGQPMPVGLAGELVIGGPGVARGYLLQDEATRERFVESALAPGARLYRTGDRARFGSDGNLDFLGRTDEQLKLRGYRIEPREIEAELESQPAVDGAGVVVVAERLLAWVRAAEGESVDADALRRHLADRLPDYMVPATLQGVDELPRLANGKLDRQALRLLGDESPRAAADPELPPSVDPLERSLIPLWESVLKRSGLGPDDDFFQSGGHSLLAVQLLLDVRERFDVELPLADLFARPRVRDMARQLRERATARSSSATEAHGVSPVQAKGTNPPIYCIHAPALDISAKLGADQPVYLVFSSVSDSDVDLTSVETIAAHYVRGIVKVQPEGPYFLLGYSFGGMVAYEVGLQLQAQGRTVAAVGLMDPTLAPVRMRAYSRLDALRRTPGVAAKMRYVMAQGPGVLKRRVAPTDARLEGPDPQERIRAQNVQRYIELGKRYRYPNSNLPCLVIVPDGHPGWLRYVRGHWSKRLGGAGEVEVIDGSRDHMDLVRPPYDVQVIGCFERFLKSRLAIDATRG